MRRGQEDERNVYGPAAAGVRQPVAKIALGLAMERPGIRWGAGPLGRPGMQPENGGLGDGLGIR